MRKLLRRPSPAMVVACLALLVALGGTGMAAATQLARNSVGTPSSRTARSRIRRSGTTRSTRRRSQRGRCSAPTSRPGQLPAGPVGPQGPAGPAGAAGPAGPAGVIGAITVRTQSVVDRRRRSRERRVQHGRGHVALHGNERAISGGTGWSDDAAGRRALTAELVPLLNPQNQVIGFLAVGRQRQRHERARSPCTPLLHAVLEHFVANSARGR